MSSASTSTTSLVSATTSVVSDTTISSRSPLTASAAAQPKDFQAAFASLQSTYGFNGTTPTPVQKKELTYVPRSTVAFLEKRAPLQTTDKNFEAAFADLQSTYGFGGSVPSPIPKPKKQGNGSSRSLFSRLVRSKKQTPLSSPSTPTPRTKTKVHTVPRATQHMIVL
ncbi:hypothetical protein K438DRAFT_1825759 [Mycena galopus ATCC 62051]|nr:hypothetical protein K438DRAFT_1825759 [Mycena galopus ATCC 62051]